MHVLITGGNGYVGRALAARLLATSEASAPTTRLTLVDQRFDPALAAHPDPRLRCLAADLAAPDGLDAALAEPVDRVFHLASVPGALAEAQPVLGYRVNLMATLRLFERLAAPPHVVPRVIFASSIAVYGRAPADAPIERDTPPAPAIAYGAHKQAGEIVLTDLSRRGMLDGVSLRLPGIVARPPAPTGHGSAFMSDVIRAAVEGRDYACPVSREAVCWWMSLPCCVDNLLHAAALGSAALDGARVWQLPVLRATVGEVVDSVARRHGAARVAGIRHAPVEAIEALFGRQPPLRAPDAEAAGFRHDGDLDRLIDRALAPA